MAGAAVLGRLTWQVAEVTGLVEETPGVRTLRLDVPDWEVTGLVEETPGVRTLRLDVPDWTGHRAGQHLDVRLTAEDGYQASRSYSIASAPGEPPAITVELRGPVGGYFVWDAVGGGPLLLVAGGSGIVPLMSMIRHRAAEGSTAPARLLYSSRTLADVVYREELERRAAEEDGLEVFQTLTRERPDGWAGFARRVDDELLAEVAWPPEDAARVFVCGPTGFVEAVAGGLVRLGHAPELIRTERFGATG